MNIYYATIITTLVALFMYILYYKLLFHTAMKEETKKIHGHQPKTSYIGWIIVIINLLVTSLIFTTFGYTFNVFVAAPAATPYILAMFFWLTITAALVNSATRTRQSQIITFLHSGFWLVVYLTYACLIPLMMGYKY